MLRQLLHAVCCFACINASVHAQESPFSGPQKGEKLPALKVKVVAGESAGKKVDIIAEAKGKPVAIMFLHKLERPAFALIRALAKFSADRKDKELQATVVFLTDDLSATEKRVAGFSRLIGEHTTLAVSPDGVEGPGTYGLNRNVILTVLVGNEGKVTGNFALVQPQAAADGPKILKSISEVSGGGEIPPIAELVGGRMAQAATQNQRMQRSSDTKPSRGQGRTQDDKLENALRRMINKEATDDQIAESVKFIEKHVAEDTNARKELARIVTTVVNSGKLKNYGSLAVQEQLKQWAKKFASDAPKTRIQRDKQTTPETTDKAKKKVDRQATTENDKQSD